MPKCIICNNNNKFKKKFEILTQCMDCKHIFADLNLDHTKIKQVYSNDYFFGNEYINYINDRKQIEKNASNRIKIIKKHTKNIINKNLYEVGCAYGFFLNSIKTYFNKVSGIDINEEAVNYAKNILKLDVEEGDLISKKNIDIKNYNIFCMFDVIEHLANPDNYIKNIASKSKGETFLYITTGDIDSLNAKIRGKNWRLIHPPSHVHYFSKKTIKLILEKNGFKVISIQYCGYYRNFLTILSKINFIKKYFNFLIKLFVYFKLSNLDIYLNLYDIMFVVAKKDSE
jgi:SAM-dependent methyltransferase|tara:strand:- start:74 stop:928 length:855 start_codon:yes stop_codon:yes gene_type:complete